LMQTMMYVVKRLLCWSLLRGNWEIARHDLNDSQVITMVPSERDFMDDYEDYLPVRTRSSAFCCRTIAIIVSSSR
jgi:hypothetical protein